MNISVQKLSSKVLYLCRKMAEMAMLHLGQGDGQRLANAVVEIVFPECLRGSGDQFQAEL